MATSRVGFAANNALFYGTAGWAIAGVKSGVFSTATGTVFDSSVKRGQPATFPLNAVIKGWTEGLQLMPTGSKWRFFIPPHLGYGDRSAGAQIGPNSTLVFEVELIAVG